MPGMPPAWTPPASEVFAHLKATRALPTSIQHWQLRDLVSCESDDDRVYCAFQNRTYECHVPSDSLKVVQDLPFKPACMTAAHGYIAAAGQGSQLDVRLLGSGECIFRGATGGTVSNAVHIGRGAAGGLRLLVSNNDTTVRVFALPSMRLLATVHTPVAVNYAALSPDGAHLACVGDSPHAYLFAATPTGFEPCGQLSVYQDAGMGCAWNPSGSCLAMGSQDGRVAVWDRRRQQAVAQLFTSGRACRCVKFSPGPADMLAFSEHTACVHLVDSRAFHASQVLRAAPEGGDCQLSGLAFAPSSRRLYVGMEQHGLAAYDIDLLARTTFSAASLA